MAQWLEYLPGLDLYKGKERKEERKKGRRRQQIERQEWRRDEQRKEWKFFTEKNQEQILEPFQSPQIPW